MSLRLADGSTLDADRVVLATGNETPASLPGAEGLAEHPAWIGDPWQAWEERLPPRDSSVVVLGTGLTAVDAIITLRAIGWMGTIHAVSRHGWFPHAHFKGIEYPEFPPPGVDLTSLGLDQPVALVSTIARYFTSAMRTRPSSSTSCVPHTQRIWAGFSPEERLVFAKSHAARWNVCPHRISPDIHAQLTHLQLTGQLQVRSAGIEKLSESPQISVHLDDGDTLVGDVRSTPRYPRPGCTATNSVLLQNLLRRGLITPDATDMGIERGGRPHGVDRRRGPFGLATGGDPLIRGTSWGPSRCRNCAGKQNASRRRRSTRVHSDEEEGPELLETRSDDHSSSSSNGRAKLCQQPDDLLQRFR